MTSEERLTRLEQVMTALAEAQVKTEDQIASLEVFARETREAQAEAQARTDAKLAQLAETMNALAEAHIKLAESHIKLADAQAKTEQQFQAYLSTRTQ